MAVRGDAMNENAFHIIARVVLLLATICFGYKVYQLADGSPPPSSGLAVAIAFAGAAVALSLSLRRIHPTSRTDQIS